LLLASVSLGSERSLAAPVPHAYGVAFGGVLYNMTPAELDTTMADVAATGATWVREQLPWSGLEPVKGDRNWAAFDKVVTAARKHHLTLDVLLGGAPAWARSAACPSAGCPPTSIGQFAGYVGAVAQRYRSSGVVGAYEIWNEPNLAATWYPGADPATYARLLRASVQAVRNADQRVRVVSGGLAPAATRGGNMDPRDFLAALCGTKVLSLVDAVGMHPYSSPAPPSYQADWNAWTQMSDTKTNILGIMERCGAGGSPIWATEYGAATGGPGPAYSQSTWQTGAGAGAHVTEQYQAQMISDAVGLAADSTWLQALFVYSLKDRGFTPTTRENFFGMQRYSGGAKPSYDAFTRAVAAAQQDQRP
jgi:hypothetical protein